MEDKDRKEDAGFFTKWFQSLRKALAKLRGKEAVELTKESLHIVSHGHGNESMSLGVAPPAKALKQDATVVGMTIEQAAARSAALAGEESAWVNRMAASTVDVLEKAR